MGRVSASANRTYPAGRTSWRNGRLGSIRVAVRGFCRRRRRKRRTVTAGAQRSRGERTPASGTVGNVGETHDSVSFHVRRASGTSGAQLPFRAWPSLCVRRGRKSTAKKRQSVRNRYRETQGESAGSRPGRHRRYRGRGDRGKPMGRGRGRHRGRRDRGGIGEGGRRGYGTKGACACEGGHFVRSPPAPRPGPLCPP